jgi:hypothetical protein
MLLYEYEEPRLIYSTQFQCILTTQWPHSEIYLVLRSDCAGLLKNVTVAFPVAVTLRRSVCAAGVT